MKNRFWEFYLVRYLSGTIFGVIILFFLFINFDTKITNAFLSDELINEGYSARTLVNEILFNTTIVLRPDNEEAKIKLNSKSELEIENGTYQQSNEKTSRSSLLVFNKTEFTFLSAIVITVAGFLYMYISSMIILVLHALRYITFELFKKLNFIPFTWFKKSINTTFSFYTDLSIIRSGENIQESNIIMSPYQTVVKSEIPNDQNKETNSRAEFIESYRHLREHGNAFGIIVAEILFAMWLRVWCFSYWSIFIWAFVGFVAWIIGTSLELKFSMKRKASSLHRMG